MVRGGVTMSTMCGSPAIGFHLMIRTGVDNQGSAIGPDLKRLDFLNEPWGKDRQNLPRLGTEEKTGSFPIAQIRLIARSSGICNERHH